MFRNKEFAAACLVSAAVLAAGVGLMRFRPSWGTPVLVLTAVLIFAAFAAVTLYRYQKIKKLTETLYSMGQGRCPVTPAAYTEGELGVLRSEIYKLADKLTGQAQFYENDKNFLAAALSDISHQLKTPLTSMAVMTELLGREDLPPDKRREFTANIQRQLERMEWLLSSLLKMARMDAGTIDFKRERLPVRKLLERAAAHLLIPMELSGIDFEIDCAEHMVLEGDGAWLAEALANVLKNCMEHTPAGGRVTVCALKNPLFVQIRISDSGSGIDPEDLPHIFERFYKGKNALPDSAGIGLAMARQILRLNAGSIEIEKTGADGTVFLVKLYQ